MLDIDKIKEEICAHSADHSVDDATVLELCEEVEKLRKFRLGLESNLAFPEKLHDLKEFQKVNSNRSVKAYHDVLVETLESLGITIITDNYKEESPDFASNFKMDCKYNGVDVEISTSPSGNSITTIVDNNGVQYCSDTSYTIGKMIAKLNKKTGSKS